MRFSRRGPSVDLDSQAIAEVLFGSDQVANMMLVGAAYQAGGLPLTADSLEQAIELNGVDVAMNLQAFRRGRQAVSDRAELQRAVAAAGPEAAPSRPLSGSAQSVARIVRAEYGSELERLVEVRVPELIAYQGRGYAERYARRVEKVRAAEAGRVPASSELAEAVAFNLHKLMAYKDEYEVARLHLDPVFRAELASHFGADASFAFRLHPPILKALGMKDKIAIPGRPGLLMFRVLAAMKRLRFTSLNPFGRDHVRKLERELIAEYEELVDELVDQLAPANHDVAVRLAALPDLVRGYEEVKLGNVERYRAELARLRAQLSDSASGGADAGPELGIGRGRPRSAHSSASPGNQRLQCPTSTT